MAVKSESTMAAAENNLSADNRKTAWYVLRAISGKEAKVKEVLDAAIKNTNLGTHVLQVLIPTEKVAVTRNGKKSVKERNLYPGYVFVECVLVPKFEERDIPGTKEKGFYAAAYVLPGEVVDTLRNTTNVIDFLRGRSKQSEPQQLRRDEIERMLGTADVLSEPVNEELEAFIVGESVKVTQGPFSGFTGTVKEVNSEKGKISVEVKIFGRPTDVALEYSEVERV